VVELVWNFNPPWGGTLELGPYVGPALTVAGILLAATLLIRLTHVFVRGVLGALLSRQPADTERTPLTVTEIKRRQDTVESLVVNVVRFFVVAIALLMILETLFANLDIGPAIAGLGIVGIAVGLGTQSLVRDYLNGALIFIENQYSIGDIVTVAGLTGRVEDFTLRRTVLRDIEGTVHTVPNSQITIASNQTRTWARVHLNVLVGYKTPEDVATALVDEVGGRLAEDPDWAPRILRAPHVERLNEFGETGFTLLVLGRVVAGHQWDVAAEMRRRVIAEFTRRKLAAPTVTSPPGRD